jgi:hypothetical protein
MLMLLRFSELQQMQGLENLPADGFFEIMFRSWAR